MALPETAKAIDFKITTQPTKTYRIDFENKRIIGNVNELEAMIQCVRKALSTRRYAERIYSGDYGTELEDMIGKPIAYIKAKTRMIIEDTFKADTRIKGIRQIEVEQLETDTAKIKAVIATQYGEIYVEHKIKG